MNMRPLILGAEQRAAAQAVLDHALANRFDMAELKRRASGDPSILPIGDLPGYSCAIPLGFMVAFSIEEQPPPLGWCRHISISVSEDGHTFPNLMAMDEICRLFGFTRTIGKNIVYQEGHNAVSILEPLDDPDKLDHLLAKKQ
jgi:hypothetical protein